MDYFCIRHIDGKHVVGYTTNGIDWYPLPKAAFGNPRDAIRYADMRQARVSPLRAAPEAAASMAVNTRASGVAQSGDPVEAPWAPGELQEAYGK